MKTLSEIKIRSGKVRKNNMNDKQFKKGIEGIKNIRLSRKEKDDIFARVTMFQRRNPFEGYTFSSWLLYSPARVIVLAALIIALAGGGIASAAEGSLPGEALYAVKVNITEPIRDVLASSPETKAEWQTTKAERRLTEAQELASRGELSTSTSNEIKELLSEHTEAFKEALKDVRQADSSKSSKSSDSSNFSKSPDSSDSSRSFESSLMSESPSGPADELKGKFKKGMDSHAKELERIAEGKKSDSSEHIESEDIAKRARKAGLEVEEEMEDSPRSSPSISPSPVPSASTSPNLQSPTSSPGRDSREDDKGGEDEREIENNTSESGKYEGGRGSRGGRND